MSCDCCTGPSNSSSWSRAPHHPSTCAELIWRPPPRPPAQRHLPGAPYLFVGQHHGPFATTRSIPALPETALQPLVLEPLETSLGKYALVN